MNQKPCACRCDNSNSAVSELMIQSEDPNVELVYERHPTNKYQVVCELKKVVICSKNTNNNHTIKLRLVDNYYDGSGIFCYEDNVRLFYTM